MSNLYCYLISFLVIYLAICLTNVTSQSHQVNNHYQRTNLYPVQPSQSQPQYYQSPPQARSPNQVNYALRPAPHTTPAQKPHVTGYRRILTLPDNKVVFHHTYSSDGNRYHEERYANNAQGQVKPIVNRALQESYLPTMSNQHATRDSSNSAPLPPSFQPVPTTAGVHYQPNLQQAQPQQTTRRILDRSNEYTHPVVLKPTPPTWSDNIESLVTYIKSSDFLNQVGTIGTQHYFKSQIIGENVKEDEKLIKSNERTGLNFTTNSDCKPKLTTIKFGLADEPEIIYNPPSVEVHRCPQACFSWQFDCIPTQRVFHNFTVAVYTINGDQVTRKTDSFTIHSHASCACSCQSLAGCFGNSKFSSQRLPPTR